MTSHPLFTSRWLPASLAALVAIAPSFAQSQESLRARVAGVPIGLRYYAPGHWGVVRVDVANSGDEDGLLPASVYLKDNPSLRFARDIWVPSHSQRTTWIPVHLPTGTAGELEQVTVRGEAGGKEFSGQARLIVDSFPMALVMDAAGLPFNTAESEEDDNDAYEVVLALRASLGLSRRVILPSDRLLPPTAEAWDAVKHVVIAGNRLADDSAGLASLRQWLASGGRIWIQLDSTSPQTARSLLGDAFRVEVVDRVALSALPDDFTVRELATTERELDEQVELVRVLVDGAQVLSQVHGWPTSFAIPFGRGEVIVTTLGPRGWMRLRNERDPPVDALKLTKYVATDPLHDLQSRFLQSPHAELPAAELQRDYLAQKIGYQVPSRTTVLSLLLGFCGLIGLAGLVLGRKHRLEHLSWLTVAAGLSVAGAVVGLGLASRQAVPATAAEVQFVEVVPEADTAVAAGSFAVYQADLNEVELASPAGTLLDPQMPDLAGQVRKLAWTDLNHWHFESMELPPGVRMFEAQSTMTLEDAPRAVARFGKSGLEGRLTPGVFLTAEDALIAPAFETPLAANLAADGSFHAGPADLLAAGQFTGDQLLSDEQLRRQKLAAAWFAGRPPHAPLRLVVWSHPLTTAMQWSAGTRQVGTLMLCVPVTIERTAADTDVAIPDALLDLRSVEGRSGRSAHFDHRTRKWQSPQASTTATRLRWQLPGAVLPLRLDRALLTVVGNIPSRSVNVFSIRDGQPVLIAQQSNLSGRVEFEISDADLPTLDDQGGIMLEIEVGELASQGEKVTFASGTWSILSTTLDVWGQTLPADQEETP